MVWRVYLYSLCFLCKVINSLYSPSQNSRLCLEHLTSLLLHCLPTFFEHRNSKKRTPTLKGQRRCHWNVAAPKHRFCSLERIEQSGCKSPEQQFYLSRICEHRTGAFQAFTRQKAWKVVKGQGRCPSIPAVSRSCLYQTALRQTLLLWMQIDLDALPWERGVRLRSSALGK